MIALAYVWFLLRVLLFPLRYALYVTHGLLIFTSKPGAHILVPAAAAAALWYFWLPLNLLVDPILRASWPALYPFLSEPLYQDLYPYRFEFAVAAAFLIGILLHRIISAVLRPLIGALPAPSRPLLPHPPFRVPQLKIRRIPVRVAVRRLPSSRLDGQMTRLHRRLSPAIRELLERPTQPAGRYPGPSELTPSKPLWPPLDAQAQPSAEASKAKPKQAKAPPASKSTAPNAKSRTTRRATAQPAAKPGHPRVPPPPSRAPTQEAAE